jgi:hypothetical protein
MKKKQPHTPEMHDTKPNREQRRHPEGRPQDTPLGRDTDTSQTDTPASREKATTGHGTTTAGTRNK